ncbi:MAG: SDR family oxidoreductase, partial [Myxococcota bacterium]
MNEGTKPMNSDHGNLEAAAAGALSVREAVRGKRLLVTGVTGFLGKVWLAHLLQHAPDVAEVL